MFLNVGKAFDGVWHKGFFYKQTALDISIAIVKIIETFLTDQIFQTKIEDCFSTIWNILAGVLQGSCLSPTLYLINVSDMPDFLKPQLLTLSSTDHRSTPSPDNPLSYPYLAHEGIASVQWKPSIGNQGL